MHVMKIIASLSVAAALLVAALAHTPVNSPQADDVNAPPQNAPAREPLKLPLVSPRIVVSKGKRRLDLYSDGRVVRTYRVGLGKNPSDDKERQGDYRTPEGEFYVCVKNAASKFYLSLGLSYPNREDAERGLRDHLITRAEHERILAALDKRQRPPWDTALGGEIFIHGGGSNSDWTWGCVALDDADVKELFDAVPMGATVLITP
jgi:murein L,D-transpeptidase YafK